MIRGEKDQFLKQQTQIVIMMIQELFWDENYSNQVSLVLGKLLYSNSACVQIVYEKEVMELVISKLLKHKNVSIFNNKLILGKNEFVFKDVLDFLQHLLESARTMNGGVQVVLDYLPQFVEILKNPGVCFMSIKKCLFCC